VSRGWLISTSRSLLQTGCIFTTECSLSHVSSRPNKERLERCQTRFPWSSRFSLDFCVFYRHFQKMYGNRAQSSSNWRTRDINTTQPATEPAPALQAKSSLIGLENYEDDNLRETRRKPRVVWGMKLRKMLAYTWATCRTRHTKRMWTGCSLKTQSRCKFFYLVESTTCP
jgi:hypothetical protein